MNDKERLVHFSGSILNDCGYFEENSLKRIAKTCTKLMISEKFDDICQGNFDLPSSEEIEECVIEEMRQTFDEKVVAAVEAAFPDMDEDDMEKYLAEIETSYRQLHDEKLRAAVTSVSKELNAQVRSIQEEIRELKRKYTV